MEIVCAWAITSFRWYLVPRVSLARGAGSSMVGRGGDGVSSLLSRFILAMA